MIRATVFVGIVLLLGSNQNAEKDELIYFPIANELPLGLELGPGFEMSLCYEVSPPAMNPNVPRVLVNGVESELYFHAQLTTSPISVGFGNVVVTASSPPNDDIEWGVDDLLSMIVLVSPQREPRVIARVHKPAPNYDGCERLDALVLLMII